MRLKTGRVVTEDEAEDKVLRILIKELTEMGAPVLTKMESTANPEHAVKALMGKYRASTLRGYLASLQHSRKWCEMGDTHQLHSPTSFVVKEEEEEGMGASEFPFYSSEEAYVSASAWLEAGYNLVKRRTWREDGSYVFNEGAFGTGQTDEGPMKYYEASAASGDVISSLRDYDGERIFAEGFERS